MEATATTPTEWPLGTTFDVPGWPCRLSAFDYSKVAIPGASDRKARLIFADPPYNLGVKYADDTSKDKLTIDEYQNLTIQALVSLRSIAGPGATLWWMTTEEHADWTGELLTQMVGRRLYRIVWEEAFAQYQGDRGLTKDYRFIFCHRVGDDGTVTFNPQDIRVPSARQAIYKDKRANSKGRVPGTTWRFDDKMDLDALALEAADRISGTDPGDIRQVTEKVIREALGIAVRVPQTPGDIWRFRRLQGTSRDRVDWHPAQLPPELLARIVRGWSNEGDLVVDAFAGSGSMARVCRATKRAFLGIDKSPTYLTRMAQELSA